MRVIFRPQKIKGQNHSQLSQTMKLPKQFGLKRAFPPNVPQLRASLVAARLSGQPMKSARELFEVLAAVTWAKLKLADSIVSSLSEETITENNLFEIVLAQVP